MTQHEGAIERDPWVFVANLSDIPPLGSRKVNLDGQRIALFRTASSQVFALEDQCPHAGGPLSEGIVHGNCVTCPLHNWVISLEDGCAQGADSGQTRRFSVRLDGERILMNRVAETIVSAPTSKDAPAQSVPS